MNEHQYDALWNLARRYGSDFDTYKDTFVINPFDLPPGYVAGWIKDKNGVQVIYVGCDEDGRISS